MKILRIDAWDEYTCPCCKQSMSVIVAVPEERMVALQLIMLPGSFRATHRLHTIQKYLEEQPEVEVAVV